MQYGALDQFEPVEEVSTINQNKSSWNYEARGRIRVLLFAIILTLTTLCVMGYKTYVTTSPTGSQLLTEASQLRIIASNEYGVFEGPYPWLKDVVGSQIVEPYKLTELTIASSIAADFPVHYEWQFSDDVIPDSSVLCDEQCSITLTKVGNHNVTVNAFDSEDHLVASFSTLLICKYVKREIRSLTVSDREKFLDAAYAIWNYNQKDGVSKYGPKFTSIGNFVAAHSEASNDNMCDEFHDGTGFLTHHLALTNSFEAAVRSVDPSVTMPYWDFTIEGEAISLLSGTPSHMTWVSPVFSNDWFGEVDADNHITNSRWAHTLMPMQEDVASGVRNSYGYIRSYWNNNPDKEITRHLFDICGVQATDKKIPTCVKHYEILDSAHLGDFLTKSSGEGHGPMHVGIGGMWGGCSAAYAELGEKWSSMLDSNVTQEEVDSYGLVKKWEWGLEAPRRRMLEKVVMGEYFHIYRSLWRSHMCAVDGRPKLLVCPESCSADTPFEDCHCRVDDLVTNQTTWQNLFPCVVASANSRLDFEASMPEAFLSDLVTMIATAPVLEGEMIESSSPSDIIFWLIHPCLERLLSAKRLRTVKSMGGLTINKWSTEDDRNSDSWLQQSVYDFKKGENPFFPDVAYECAGHGADSSIIGMTHLTDVIEKSGDLNGDGVISNWEFYAAIDPSEPARNDYVFDHFKWDHCVTE